MKVYVPRRPGHNSLINSFINRRLFYVYCANSVNRHTYVCTLSRVSVLTYRMCPKIKVGTCTNIARLLTRIFRGSASLGKFEKIKIRIQIIALKSSQGGRKVHLTVSRGERSSSPDNFISRLNLYEACTSTQ